MLRGKRTLFIDQYGNRFWASTLSELKAQLSGRVEKMYTDKVDGSTYHTGYVIGQHWLTAYRPAELRV